MFCDHISILYIIWNNSIRNPRVSNLVENNLDFDVIGHFICHSSHLFRLNCKTNEKCCQDLILQSTFQPSYTSFKEPSLIIDHSFVPSLELMLTLSWKMRCWLYRTNTTFLVIIDKLWNFNRLEIIYNQFQIHPISTLGWDELWRKKNKNSQLMNRVVSDVKHKML